MENHLERQALSAVAGYPASFFLVLPMKPCLENWRRKLAEFSTDRQRHFGLMTGGPPRKKELWPWLAILALILFVGDVALRRWPKPAPASRPPPVSRRPEPALHT